MIKTTKELKQELEQLRKKRKDDEERKKLEKEIAEEKKKASPLAKTIDDLGKMFNLK